MSSRPAKILVRGVNWIGDAVMTTPALQRLREAHPAARIELLTHQKIAPLWEGHPAVDAVIAFSAAETVFQVARRLRPAGFDTAVVLPNSPRSALEVFLARIPARIGCARGGRSWLLSRAVPRRPGAVEMHKRSDAEIRARVAKDCARDTFPPDAHQIHDYLRLAAELGANPEPLPPLLHVSHDEVSAARAKFGLASGDRMVALNAGAEYGPAKRWPAERFVEAAARVHQATRCRLLILGGPADAELAGTVAGQLASRVGEGHVVNLAGRTTLRELCAVMKASALLLGNDSGPMHIAAALGTPVIVPFGSTAPELTGPLPRQGVRSHAAVGRVPCAPCFRRECPIDLRCLKSITADEISAAALRCLDGAA